MTFEKVDPHFYQLYQEELFQDLLQCFIKQETLIKENKVWKIDVDNPVHRLRKGDIFTGHQAETIIKSCPRLSPVVPEFYDQAIKAYAMCVKQLQKSMPIENNFLISV